jgi:RHS repeat-associated protein
VEDRYGNRWTQSANGTGNASAVQPNLAFYGNNNQVSGWDYDAAGNLTNDNRNTYAYDAEGRIVSLNSAPTYAYDAEGRRVAKLGSGGTVATSYLLDLSGNQVTELNATGGWKHSNVWAGRKLLATYEGPAGTGTVGYHFHLTDWLGTQRMQTTAAGNQEEECYSYPFGDGLTCTGTDATEHHFTSKERDTESGLDYFGARYLSSDLGRFMTPDWAAKPTAVPYALFGDPQSLNLYAYVGNNPNTGIDLDGHLGGNNLESYPMESYSDGQPNYDDHPAANSGSVPATPAPPDTAQEQNTNGAASPSGGSGNALNAAEMKTVMADANSLAAACAATFASVIPGFSLSSFDSTMQNATYNQYPALGSAVAHGAGSSTEANTVSTGPMKGRFTNLFSDFFRDTSHRQAGVIVHENIHRSTGWSDSNVFYMFQNHGMRPSEINNFIHWGNTDGITTWVLRGCQ